MNYYINNDKYYSCPVMSFTPVMSTPQPTPTEAFLEATMSQCQCKGCKHCDAMRRMSDDAVVSACLRQVREARLGDRQHVKCSACRSAIPAGLVDEPGIKLDPRF